MRALLVICCLAWGLLLGSSHASAPRSSAHAASTPGKPAIDERWRLIADDLAKTVSEGLPVQADEELRAFSIQTADDSPLGKALASYLVTDLVHRGYAPAGSPSGSTISLRWGVRLIRHNAPSGRAPVDASAGTPLGRGVSRLARPGLAWSDDASAPSPARLADDPAGTEVVVQLSADVAGKPCLRRVRAYFVSDPDLPGHAEARAPRGDRLRR